jgi:hypothetical protein
MYRSPEYPGAIVEWRHTSTSSPLSWNPEKHIASETSVRHHAHRFVRAERTTSRCDVSGCGTEQLDREVTAKPEAAPLGEREAKAQASRKRGSYNSRASHQKQPLVREG